MEKRLCIIKSSHYLKTLKLRFSYDVLERFRTFLCKLCQSFPALLTIRTVMLHVSI